MFNNVVSRRRSALAFAQHPLRYPGGAQQPFSKKISTLQLNQFNFNRVPCQVLGGTRSKMSRVSKEKLLFFLRHVDFHSGQCEFSLESQHLFDPISSTTTSSGPVFIFYYRSVVPALGAVVCGPCAALAPGPAEKPTYSWLFRCGGIYFLIPAGGASPRSRAVWALRRSGAQAC